MSIITGSVDDSRPPEHAAAGDRPVLTVRAAGELLDVPAMTAALQDALSAPFDVDVAVDLSAVTYLSFEALPPLIRLVQHRTTGLDVVVSETVRRKLALLGLDTSIPLRPALRRDERR